MRAWMTAAAAILVAGAAWADVARFGIAGDLQNCTSCVNATTAWDHCDEAFNWAAVGGDLDFLFATGDLVDKFALSGGTDCFCMGTANPGTCAQIEHPIFGVGNCSNCGDTEAINCVGGTAGSFCEYTRARALADKLDAVGLPWWFTSGNHDADTLPPFTPSATPAAWTTFVSYFGARRLSTSLRYRRIFVIENRGVELPPAGSHVVRAAGADWLFVHWPVIPWYIPIANGAKKNREDLKNWTRTVLRSFRGLPTAVTGHIMMTSADGTGTSGRDCGLCEDDATAAQIMGRACMELAEEFPQIMMCIGGHERKLNHEVTYTSAGHGVLGIVVDTSFGADDVDPAHWLYTSVPPMPGDPPYPSTVEPGVLNGGGGIIHVLNVDPVRGVLWMENYSPEEQDRDERVGQTGSRWTVSLPMCEDSARFSWPDGACTGGM